MCCCRVGLSLPLPFLVLGTILLSWNVEAQWVNSHDLTKFVDDVNSGAVSFEPNRTAERTGSFLRNYDGPGMVGDVCTDEEPCREGLECVGFPPLFLKQCLPPPSCLARAAQEFNSTFNWNQWMDGILAQANLTQNEIFDAAHSATSGDDFQSNHAIVRFVNAFQTSPRPTALQGLQDAADKCTPAVMARGPTTQGAIAYMGLHFEISLLGKFAFSVYGALGNNPAPTSWTRITYGLEAGAGVEISWLIGFACTGTTSDMNDGAIVLDADIGLGLGIGVALVIYAPRQNANLEFTVGPSIGVGLGYSISVATALDNPPSPAPTLRPTIAPTVAPTLKPTVAPTL